MKRIFSLALALTLAFSLLSLPAAAEGPELAAAETLRSLGLFMGTGDIDGVPQFELARSTTRLEALAVMLRLFGEEESVLSYTGDCPFGDLTGGYSWGAPYAAFAYDRGYTDGTGEGTFSPGEPASANMFITFVLRALGYADKGEARDFSYEGANEFSAGLGLTGGEYAGGEDLLRGDLTVISLSALSQPLKREDGAKETTLVQKLVDAGAVDAGAALAAGFAVTAPAEPETVILPAYGEASVGLLKCVDISAAFPTAAWIVFHSGTERSAAARSMFELTQGANCMKIGTAIYVYYYPAEASYILDAEKNILGWVEPQEPGDAVTVKVGDPHPGLYNEVTGRIEAAMAGCAADRFTFSPVADGENTRYYITDAGGAAPEELYCWVQCTAGAAGSPAPTAAEALGYARGILFDMFYKYPAEGPLPDGSSNDGSRFISSLTALRQDSIGWYVLTGDFWSPAGSPEKHCTAIFYDGFGNIVTCSVLY